MASKTALPTEQTPIKMGPELAEVIEELLEELEGEDRNAGRAAVMAVYKSGISGMFGEIVEAYRAAISEAVGFNVGTPPDDVAELSEGVEAA